MSETPSRQQIFTCRPTRPLKSARARGRSSSRLGGEAYRRPLTPREVDRLMPFYESGAAKGGFEGGMRTALEAILASPHFIFRLEKQPVDRRAGRDAIASPTSTSPRGSRSSCGARRRIRSC